MAFAFSVRGTRPARSARGAAEAGADGTRPTWSSILKYCRAYRRHQCCQSNQRKFRHFLVLWQLSGKLRHSRIVGSVVLGRKAQ